MATPFAQIGMALGLLAGTGLVFGAIQSFGLFSAATAAWVQAVGSVGVVVGAVIIANRQSREMLRREERERRAAEHREEDALKGRRIVAVALLMQCKDRLEGLAALVRDEGALNVNTYAKRVVEIGNATAARFEVETLRDPELIAAFGQATAGLHVILDHIEHRASELPKIAEKAKKREHLLKLADQIDSWLTKLDPHIEKLSP